MWKNENPCSIIAESKTTNGKVISPQGELLFLNVEGTFTEMATQMGMRLKDEIHQGTLPFFSEYIEKTLLNSPMRKVARTINWALFKTITDRLRSNITPHFTEALDAFADAAEFPKSQMYKAVLAPETFLWVLGTYYKFLKRPPAKGLAGMPVYGCTSAISVPPRSQTTLHARNFDYFGMGYWDKFATLTFYNPVDGMDYVGVGSAGTIGGGVTCMNRAGLTFVVHQHFPDTFDMCGIPVGIAGEQVAKYARNIDEAVEILRDFPPFGGWTYIMSEGDTGRAAVFEVAAGKESLSWLNPEENALGYANVYWGENLKDTEIDYYPEYRRCNYARQNRVATCVGSPGNGRVEAMATILGDAVDPETGKERILGPSILTPMTVASVVFEPEHRRVWVAAGNAPTSRGWFVPFTLGGGPGEGRPDVSQAPFETYSGWREKPEGRAFALYQEALIGSLDGMPAERKLVLIEHAIALAPDDPALHVIAGLLSLKLDNGQRAEGSFRRGRERTSRSDRKAEITLYLAWALDLQKQRGAAKKLYQEVVDDKHADEASTKRAKQGKWVRFKKEHANNLTLDLTYGGVP